MYLEAGVMPAQEVESAFGLSGLSKRAENAIRNIPGLVKGIEIVYDARLPMNAAGAMIPGENIVRLNPWLLMMIQDSTLLSNINTHIVKHETLHVNGISDEALTEALTQASMEKDEGVDKFPSGYQDLVDQFWGLMGGKMSFDELIELVEFGNQQQTFFNILEFITIGEGLIFNDMNTLTGEAIRGKLNSVWPDIQELFPRTLNSMAQNGRGLHDGTNVNVSPIQLDQIQDRIAKRLISEHPETICEVIDKAIEHVSELDETTISLELDRMGFAYLGYFDRSTITKLINQRISVKTLDEFSVVTGYSQNIIPVIDIPSIRQNYAVAA